MSKPSLPQGTRDFTAATVHKRRFILDIIRSVFELHGFEPLETPALENLETLTGKYGEEGDKLIFKILNNGLSDPKNYDKANEGFKKLLEGKNTASLTERALKYDLTIPFARHIAMNSGTINFPYKRYQIQPVWRADRPQKGRYREFTQCDADVAGSGSLLNEAELCHIYHRCFEQMGLKDYDLRINNRKILSALAETAGAADLLTDITVAIDKLDKIGIDEVKKELRHRGVAEKTVSVIEAFLIISGTNAERIAEAEKILGDNSTGKKGIDELKYLVEKTADVNITIDFTLARGLNYYTGMIFEVKAPSAIKMGSIGGGGRYDDLTGLFGVSGITGVGISFGIDRIYDVLEEMNLFPQSILTAAKVIFFNLGDGEADVSIRLANELRDAGIGAEVYPEKQKLEKQFKYADKKNIPFAAIIGSKELEAGECTVKDLRNGRQETISFEKLKTYFAAP